MGIAIVICPVTIGYNVNIDTFVPFFGLSNEFLWNLGQVESSCKFLCHNYKFLLIYSSATWRAQFLSSLSIVGVNPFDEILAVNLISGKVGFCTCEINVSKFHLA